MTEPLGDLLHASTDRVRPVLPPAREVRRHAERRRRTRRAAATLAAAAATVGVVLLGSSQLNQPPTSKPDVLTTQPGSSQRLHLLSDDPFLDPVYPGLVRTGAPPTPLSSCVNSPLTWGAAASSGVRYVTPGRATPVFNEFVLRYDSVAEARRAVAHGWRQFARCPRKPTVVTDPLRAPAASARYRLDEWFENQRATFANAKMRGQPVHMYALRVASRANIVVLIEDVGAPDDRAIELLDQALSTATRTSAN